MAADLNRLCQDGLNRHFITRAKSTSRLRTIERLGKDDALVEIELSAQTRRAQPDLPGRWTARAITYQRSELAALYHERWEIELGVNALSFICHAWIIWSSPPLAPGRIPDGMSNYNRKRPTGHGRH